MSTNSEVIILISRSDEELGGIFELMAFEYSETGRHAAHTMAQQIVADQIIECKAHDEQFGIHVNESTGITTYEMPGDCVVEIYDSVEVREG